MKKLIYNLKHTIAKSIVLRLCTAPFRLLPDFLIIGESRCGTTSLYFNLIKHPNVGSASRKEVNFFVWYYQHGINWYRSYFPLVLWKKLKEIEGQPFVTGEASLAYLSDIYAPKRVWKHLPGVKLIILLRNPVDRAFSHYRSVHLWETQEEKETLSFEEALEKEDERIKDDFIMRSKNANYQALKYWLFSYKARGIYVERLKRWSAYFKRENTLILNSEEFFRDTEKVYYQVLRFLGLPLWRPKEFIKHSIATDDLKLKDSTRKWLIEYFKPHNERLYEYLGYRFDWDK